MKPIMQGMAGGGLADRARMMQQLQSPALLSDPTMSGMKVKKEYRKTVDHPRTGSN